jgi:hypothetical protein
MLLVALVSLRQSHRTKYSLPARQCRKIPNNQRVFTRKPLHCAGPAETQNSLSPAAFLPTFGLRGFSTDFVKPLTSWLFSGSDLCTFRRVTRATGSNWNPKRALIATSFQVSWYETAGPSFPAQPSGRQCTVWLLTPSEAKLRSRIKPGAPKIQPSTCATARSGGVSSGFRNAARLPLRSARDSQAATQ